MQFVHSNVVFVAAEADVHAAVALMRDRNISSVLVIDVDDRVTGIVTERDIVHNFTLLDMKDKLGRKVETIMSRPVHFARQDHLVEDVIDLHFKHKIRHFPIVRDPKSQSKDTVVGIVSITDIARGYLHSLEAPKADVHKGVALKEAPLQLFVMAHDDELYASYRGIFTALGYEVSRVGSTIALPTLPKAPARAVLLVDMDGYAVQQLEQLLAAVRGVKVPVIFATTQRELLEPFKKGLAGTRRDIALKPIDVSYCHWAFMNWLR